MTFGLVGWELGGGLALGFGVAGQVSLKGLPDIAPPGKVAWEMLECLPPLRKRLFGALSK